MLCSWKVSETRRPDLWPDSVWTGSSLETLSPGVGGVIWGHKQNVAEAKNRTHRVNEQSFIDLKVDDLKLC